jgi:hypothetical protein
VDAVALGVEDRVELDVHVLPGRAAVVVAEGVELPVNTPLLQLSTPYMSMAWVW